MSTGGTILFVACAVLAIAGAVFTVSVKNPLRAAMGLLLHIIALAGLFLTLHAHLLAALQLLVYAGAVVVLFVFVIMLIGPEAEVTADTGGLPRLAIAKTASVALMTVVTGAIAFSLLRVASEPVALELCESGAECGQFGGVVGLGSVIYREAMVPFELISVLLTVAIIGALAVARGRTPNEVREARRRREERIAEEAEERARAEKLSAEVSAHGGH